MQTVKINKVATHLLVSCNDGPKQYQKSVQNERTIPKGFGETACERIFGGGEYGDGTSEDITCEACRKSVAFEQLLILEEMED